MSSNTYRLLRYRKRWFCYLDLLGFRALVQTNAIDRVIPLYQEAQQHLETVAKPQKRNGLIYSWFSDTFIIYSKDDGEKDFASVEHVGRVFFQKLILNQIPVRGAIAHGDLYSQSAKNIFVGGALIDAYDYAEKQAWLGFILTPSVFDRLAPTSIPLGERAHYRLVTEQGIIQHKPDSPVYAFAFNNGTVNGNNPYLDALNAMMATAPESTKDKYRNTIAFAIKHSSGSRTSV